MVLYLFRQLEAQVLSTHKAYFEEYYFGIIKKDNTEDNSLIKRLVNMVEKLTKRENGDNRIIETE